MKLITGKLKLSDTKRVQIPNTFIDVTCSVCGVVHPVELVDQIEYPEEGETHSVYHECCDVETEVEFTLECTVIITLKD